MNALVSARLLPLLRCHHAALHTAHSCNFNSILWRSLPRQCSVVELFRNRKSAQLAFPYAQFRALSLSRISTAINGNSDRPRRKINRPKVWDEPVQSKVDEQGDDFVALEDPKLTLVQRFQRLFKKYWWVMLPIHLAVSATFFLFFCYLASRGFSPIPLLEKYGLFEDLLKWVKDSFYENIAVAAVFLKLSGPVRAMTTLYITGALGRRGKILTSSQVWMVIKKHIKNKTQNW